jgi:hypothetical protein
LVFGQDHRRPALVRPRGREGGVQLAEVVPAALQRIDLVDAHVRDQRCTCGSWRKKCSML